MGDITPEYQDSNTQGEGPRDQIPEVPSVEAEAVIERSISIPPGSRSEFVNRQQPSASYESRAKAQLLEMLQKFFPNTSRALIMSGVTRREFKKWLTEDQVFLSAVEEIRETLCDELEGIGVQNATRPGGFMFWMATLRRHRPQIWGTDKHLAQPMGPIESDQIETRRANLARVIATDAEIIEATTGDAPPQVPADRPADPEPTSPEPPSETVQRESTEPPPIPENQKAYENPVETSDDVGPLDSGADFLQTHRVDQLDPSDFSARRAGRNAPPKKPNRPDSISTPPPSSPDKKQKGDR